MSSDFTRIFEEIAKSQRRLLESAGGAVSLQRTVEQLMRSQYPKLQLEWLSELADFGAAEIAASNAARQITELAQGTAIAAATSALATYRFAVPTSVFEEAIAASNSRILSIVTDATRVSLTEWVTRLSHHFERQADARVRRHGWWTLPSWSDQELTNFGESAHTMTKRQFRRHVCDYYRRNRMRALRRMVDGWMDLRSYRDRRGILREAIASHGDRRFRVAIPALLPVVEGVASEEFPLPRRKTSVPTAVRALLDEAELEEIETAATLTALEALYEGFERGVTPRRSGAVRRHPILHGYSIRYGGEANSLHVFFVLDLLHAQAITRRRLHEAA